MNFKVFGGCLAAVLCCGGLSAPAQTVAFSDDFNRPDGPVGNGWSVTNSSTLLNGAANVFYNGLERGRIYRAHPVQYPISFAFDFRTENPGSACGGTSCLSFIGGWRISWNAPEPGTPGGAQYSIFMPYQSRTLIRSVNTSVGIMDDSVLTTAPQSGLTFVRIEGIIRPDLSASIRIAGVEYQFGPPSVPAVTAQYNNLILTCDGGGPLPFIFDNFSISPTDAVGPETRDLSISPSLFAVGTPSLLNGTIDDSATGGSGVAAGKYSVDFGSELALPLVTPGAVTTAVSFALPAFAEAGVHYVCARGIDSRGNVGSELCTAAVVYDPSAGYVIGNGKIQSPAGSDWFDSSASGLAEFAFSSKYQKGDQTPTGKLSFSFKAGNLEFTSTSMEWLVVTGEPKAMIRGEGLLNQTHTCKFHVEAWDGSYQAINGPTDAFGIEIGACTSGGGPFGHRYRNRQAIPLSSGHIMIKR